MGRARLVGAPSNLGRRGVRDTLGDPLRRR